MANQDLRKLVNGFARSRENVVKKTEGEAGQKL